MKHSASQVNPGISCFLRLSSQLQIEVWVVLWVSAVDRGMGSAVGQCCG